MKPIENKINRLKFLEPFISIVFWFLMFISPLIFGNFENGIEWEHIFKVWKSFIPYLALFLLNRFVFLPLFFFRGRKLLYFIANLVLISVMAFGVHFYQVKVLQPSIQNSRFENREPGREGAPHEGYPVMGERGPALSERPPVPRERPPMFRDDASAPMGRDVPPTNQPPKQLPPFLSFLVISVLIVGFDTGLMISVKWAQSEQDRIKAEKENMASQLAFLQNQVSPHFFMNTLNNIHSLIDIDTDEAKEAIIKLSKLMRHMLYDSQEAKIPLKKEIDFILNYVELMKLRFSNKVKINLQIPDQIPDKNIPPLLFTSFVENAFKHGISYQKASFIDISCIFESDQLSFTVKNSNPKIKKDEGPSGIGIENSRKRLDLIYGDSYTLEILESADEFIVKLKVPV